MLDKVFHINFALQIINMKKIVFAAYLGMAFLMSCGDKEIAEEKNLLEVGSNVYSLENVNFYLISTEMTGLYNDNNDYYTTRRYAITDAVLVNPESSTDIFSTSYSGGSFVFYFTLSTVFEEPFESGSYVTIYDGEFAPVATNRSYISFDADDHLWLTAKRNSVSLSEIDVIVNEEELTISFNANMFDGESNPYLVNLKMKGIPTQWTPCCD